MNDNDLTLIIRDKRGGNWFWMHNLIEDHYRPLIGSTGLDLYTLYARVRNNEEEKAVIPRSIILPHLGIGPATLTEYNRVLEWCGLVHINRQNHRVHGIYLLEPEPITPERLEAIREIVIKGTKSKYPKLRQTMLKRIDTWRSLTDRRTELQQANSVPTLMRTAEMTGQLPLFDKPKGSATEHEDSAIEHTRSATEHEDSAAERKGSATEHKDSAIEHERSAIKHTGSVAEHKGSVTKHRNSATEHKDSAIERRQQDSLQDSLQDSSAITTKNFEDDNPVVVALANIGVVEPVLTELANCCPVKTKNWIAYANSLPHIRNKAGFVIKKLRRGLDPPDILAETSMADRADLFQEQNQQAETDRLLSLGAAGVRQEDLVAWRETLGLLRYQMTAASFDRFLRDTGPIRRDDDTLVIGLKNADAIAWVENRLKQQIERTAQRHGLTQLTYEVHPFP